MKTEVGKGLMVVINTGNEFDFCRDRMAERGPDCTNHIWQEEKHGDLLQRSVYYAGPSASEPKSSVYDYTYCS